jgi:hypothetical protein
MYFSLLFKIESGGNGIRRKKGRGQTYERDNEKKERG